MKSVVVFISFFLLSFALHAQQEKRAAARGNNAYNSESYDDAMQRYEHALELKEDYYEGGFNLGNSLLRKSVSLAEQAEKAEDEETKKKLLEEAAVLNEQAANRFKMMAESAENKSDKAKAFHNMGNAKLMSGDIDGSIESYKNGLRNNPGDNETRYNLAYAQYLKKKQEEQQQDQDQDQDEDKDKDKDKDQDQDKDQDKQDQDNQDQQDQDQQQDPSEDEQKEGDEQEQEPQPNQLSHEDAKEMLKALQQEEDNIQQKLKKKQGSAVRTDIERDW